MIDRPNLPPSRAHDPGGCAACHGRRWVTPRGASGLVRCGACRYVDPATGTRASFPFPGSVDSETGGNWRYGTPTKADPADVAEAAASEQTGRRAEDRTPDDTQRALWLGIAIGCGCLAAILLAVGIFTRLGA